jgi:Zn-dependent protease
VFNIQTLFSNPLSFLVGLIALAVSIGTHEFAHVLSAYLQGDQTGKALGRLTLNPIKHLDPWGTVAIIFAGIGWGKPAPFNPYNLKHPKWGSTLVAIAGPISNVIIVAITGYALLLVGPHLRAGNLLLIFLQTMVILNAALAVFNLIPVTPLDGSYLLRALLGPNNALVITLERYGFILILALVLLGGGILSIYISGGVNLLFRILGLGRLMY